MMHPSPAMTAIPDLLKYGADHVFHMRYCGPDAVSASTMLVRASGSILETSDGRRIIDAVATHHNVNLGHCHPELSQAIYGQLLTLGHVVTTPGFTNEPMIRATEAILRNGLPSMASVFYKMSGAEAVETCLKIARYYWNAKGRKGKSRFISLRLGYHGNTLATLAACGRDHDGVPAGDGQELFPMFSPLPEGFLHVRGPYDFHDGRRSAVEEAEAAALELENLIRKEGAHTIAAFLFEPMQGHNFYSPDGHYYRRVRELCDHYEILMISDEMITGFGRTGAWWGMSQYDVQPDITAFGKGITGGHVPLGGAICSAWVWETIRAHSPNCPVEITGTYSGHPVLCAAGAKTVEIIERENYVANNIALGEHLRAALRDAFEGTDAFEVRGQGLIGVIELKSRENAKDFGRKIAMEALKRDVLIRVEQGTVGPLISVTPPFITTTSELDKIAATARIAHDAALKAM